MPSLAEAIIETASLDAMRLRGRAYESLKTYELDPRKAVGDFLAAVRSDRGLLFELIGYVAARDCALVYLEGAAAEMRNEKEGGEAPGLRDRHTSIRSSPSAPSPNAGEQHTATLNAENQVAALPAPPSDGGDAHQTDERRWAARSSSSETRRAPIPLPKRGSVELKAIKESSPVSAFDSIRLRDSTRIGDLPWRLIPRFIRDNSYEAALLIKVRAYCVPSDEGALIREVVPPAEFERMVQQAAQVAEAVQ